MKLIRNLLMGTLFTFSSTACYYDHEATLYENVPCQVPTEPSFGTDVLPLLNVRCNTCHAGSSPSAGIKLNSHAEVMKYVTNGSLMGSINHASGFSAMPKNAGKMSNCDINKIKNWIDSGSPNN